MHQTTTTVTGRQFVVTRMIAEEATDGTLLDD